MGYRQAPEMDLKNQVLSDYLFVKRGAKELYDSGSPWFALLKLETFTCDLALKDDTYYEKIDDVMKVIEVIRAETRKIQGHTSSFRMQHQWAYKNRSAKRVFHKTLRELTKILRDAGYFEFLINSQKSFVNPARGRKSFTKKK